MTDNQQPRTDSTRTRHASQHSTRSARDYSNRSTRTSRSTAAHRCITIRGRVPASGRPRTCIARATRALARFTIMSGWSGC